MRIKMESVRRIVLSFEKTKSVIPNGEKVLFCTNSPFELSFLSFKELITIALYLVLHVVPYLCLTYCLSNIWSWVKGRSTS